MNKLMLLIASLLLSVTAYANNFTLTQQTKTENAPHATISLQYPQLTSTEAATAVEEFNHLIDEITTNEVTAFKSLVADANSTQESTLTIKYEAYQIAKPYLSIRFIISNYVASGAYPNVHHRVLNFNLETGKVITLEELFKPDAHYTELLDSYCIKTLSKKTNIPATEIKDSSALNYKHWNMTRDGILISFDDFPHALGEPEVMIPYAHLKDQLAIDPQSLQTRNRQ